MTDLPKPVRLWTTRTAPNPRRVHAVMIEKSIDLELRDIDIMGKDHYAADYIAKAGAPTVPVLELEDGSCLTETVAISRYLEALWPEPNLLGANPLEAAQIEMWQRRVEFGLLQTVTFAFRHAHPAMKDLEDQVPEWSAANHARIEAGKMMLESVFETRPFVAGERFTIADITAYIALDFAKVVKLGPDEKTPALRAYYKHLSERACFAK